MSHIPALPPIPTKSSPVVGQPAVAATTIDTKLFRLEKITETLLEEIVHLQGELNGLRKPDNDELRLIRSQLKRITEKQDQLQSRVANEEQKSVEKDQALTYLLQSSRDLEKKTNNQQIILCRRDILESQFNHLQSGVDAMQEKWRTYQDQMERRLSEDSERLGKLIETIDLQHTEQLVNMKNIKLTLETQQESLVEEMNDKITKMHRLLDHTNNKLSILGNELLEQCDGQRRDTKQWLSKLQEDVNMFVRDFNKKINSCSDAARDGKAELHNAMQSLQQWCHKQHMQQAELVQQCEEQVDRTSKLFQVTTRTIQSTCESQANKKIEAQSKQLKDEINEKFKIVQSQLQREKVKISQLLAELHKSIDIIQKEMEMTKEDTNKVIFAEIASRFREFDGMREQHSKLLQQLDQMRKELTDFTTEHCRQEIEQAFHNMIDGIINKLDILDDMKKLHSQFNTLQEELKCRLSKLSCEHDQLQQDLLVWRKECVDNVDDVQTTLSPLAEQLSQLEEQVEVHKQELTNKMEADWLERRAKLKELQKQITYCVTMDTYQQQISSHDQRLLSLEGRVHTVALNNTKLENSIHKTEVKLVQQVSMETKQRLSAIQQMREQISLLQSHPQIRRTSSTTPVPATPTSRVRPHRKLHNRYRLNSVSSRDDDDATAMIQQHETQGVFTSAPATPESQQNLIVQDLSHDQSSPVSQHVTDQHDHYPLPDQFSPVVPSSATTNLSLNQYSLDQNSSNQQPPDQHSPNHQPADQHSQQHSPNGQFVDQQPADQHSSDQQIPIQTDTHSVSPTLSDKTSPTHFSN